MRFESGGSDSVPTRPGRRPPPNYFSRSTRWRLFVVVAAVLFVAAVIEKWNSPAVQRMLGLGDRSLVGGPPLADHEIADQEVDTRLPPPRTREDLYDFRFVPTPTSQVESPNASFTTASPSTGPAAEASTSGVTGGDKALEAAWHDAWLALLRECPAADENRLYDRLRAARGHGPPLEVTPAETTAWSARLAAWDSAWTKYVMEARASLATQPPEDRAHWEKLLDGVAGSWLALWRPLLETLGQQPPESREITRLVGLLQETVDEKALGAIQDDTIWRGSETNIWFRLVEQIRAIEPEQLRRESLGPTGYLQLFKQPEHYRGKVVTVRGTVRLAYRVDAPSNESQVREYTLLWLHPAGGPTSPIVIYALETPEGFPAIKHRDRDRGTTELREEVEVTGYFFKRWAYEGRDGIHVAPLLLARSPRWTPPAADDETSPRGATIVAVVLLSAAIGIGVAVLVLRNTRRGSTES
jgi:hypothetical protein